MDRMITTRQILIHHYLDRALDGKDPNPDLDLSKVNTSDFKHEVTLALAEACVYEEAVALNAQFVSEPEIQKSKDLVLKRYEKNQRWKKLGVTSAELTDSLKLTLRSRKLIDFKIKSSGVLTTDSEAKTYFVKNKGRFENPSFEANKTQIVTYLNKVQRDRRLREWLDFLQIKYRARNFISGNQ